MKTVQTEVLEIAFLDEGPAAGWPVILVHGFPYDVHAFDEVVPRLAQAGARVIVPYLRGFGPTRFLHKDTMRTGQQAALGHDVIDLLDALGIQRANPGWQRLGWRGVLCRFRSLAGTRDRPSLLCWL